ncbi:hypothetical protein [Trinickia mobilis]|uniref:hypothetical protein n=1 Tax=Trinickia mobilis TaxID=2816356 RepID=UPI001A907978|nr:hypothetical protein [Trinickia mobilis]
MSTWLIGTVVPMPSAADEMIDDADGVEDVLLVVEAVLVPVVAVVAVLPVAEIGVDMGSLCLWGWRGAPVVRRFWRRRECVA